MLWLFALLGLVVVVVIGLVVLGRETARLSDAARPAVFDLTEAVHYIADQLPPEAQARLTHDDVRFVLLADADLLEEATAEVLPEDEVVEVVDEEIAIVRAIDAAERTGRDLTDEDIVAILDGRAAYLRAIGAIGPEA